MTKHFEFSPEIVEEINYQRYNHLAPIVQRRMDAIRLKAYGLLHKQIAEIIGITENTLRDYFELYEQGSLEKLKENLPHAVYIWYAGISSGLPKLDYAGF